MGTIDFEHVDFGYTPSNVFMKNINIHIPAGSMVAIVGPTGAGKSTLVNLIMRFYDIKNGRITIDGVDIRDLSRESLHNTVGMVLQDAWIFTGTIADNIGYGKPNATREEIEYVARLAWQITLSVHYPMDMIRCSTEVVMISPKVNAN